MFQSKVIDVATYIVAHAKEGKLMASTDVKYLLQQLGGQTLVELTLIVGDPRFPDGIVWNLGTLKMDPALLKDSATAEPMLPRRLHESQLKPEIQHLFVHAPYTNGTSFPFLSLSVNRMLGRLLWCLFSLLSSAGVRSLAGCVMFKHWESMSGYVSPPFVCPTRILCHRVCHLLPPGSGYGCFTLD